MPWSPKPENAVRVRTEMPNNSGCIVSLVDGLAWNEEDGGSNPLTPTRYKGISMLDKRWVAENGNIFVDESFTKRNSDYKYGEFFEVRNSVAFNVGQRVAQHIVDLHNASLTK